MYVRVLHIKMNSLRKGTCLLKLKKTSPPKYMGVSHWKNKQVFKQPPLFSLSPGAPLVLYLQR